MTHDGIDLPVAPVFSTFHGIWPFSDVTLIGQSSTTIVGLIAFPALLRGLAKVRPEMPAQDPVSPYVLIDGFVTRNPLHEAKAPEMANNLFRRPLLPQEGSNELEIVLDVMAITP